MREGAVNTCTVRGWVRMIHRVLFDVLSLKNKNVKTPLVIEQFSGAQKE